MRWIVYAKGMGTAMGVNRDPKAGLGLGGFWLFLQGECHQAALSLGVLLLKVDNKRWLSNGMGRRRGGDMEKRMGVHRSYLSVVRATTPGECVGPARASALFGHESGSSTGRCPPQIVFKSCDHHWSSPGRDVSQTSPIFKVLGAPTPSTHPDLVNHCLHFPPNLPSLATHKMAGSPADAWCLLKMLCLCKGGWHLLIWLQITFEVYAQLFKIPPRSGPLFEAGVCLRVILFSLSSADWMYIYLFCFVLFKNLNIHILKNAALKELLKPSNPQVWNSSSLMIKSKLSSVVLSCLHSSTFISDFKSNLSHITSLCFSLLWFFL